MKIELNSYAIRYNVTRLFVKVVGTTASFIDADGNPMTINESAL